jgi:hypothetical protein
MSFKRQCSAIALLAVFLGCSHRKTVDQEEFISQLKAAVSLCAESRLFVNYLREGKSSQSFSVGHTRYLQQLASDDLQDANKADVPAQLHSQFQVYREQLEALSRQLEILQASQARSDALTDIDSKLQTIQGALDHLRSGL